MATSKKGSSRRNSGAASPSGDNVRVRRNDTQARPHEVDAQRLQTLQLEHQARVAEAQRAELLAVASHDLRNPLGVILVTTTMLARELSQANQVEQIAAIRRAAMDMTQVIEDLVDGAHIDAGTLDLGDEDCEPVEVVREAAAAARQLVGERQIAIEESIPGDLPALRMPRHRLLQVFSRVVANALRFMPKAGTLVFEVVRERQTLRFSVTDSGPLVPESQRPYSFARRPPPGRRSGRGTGLGMFVVKGIVEAHGGRVELVSDEARGNRVSFTLPV